MTILLLAGVLTLAGSRLLRSAAFDAAQLRPALWIGHSYMVGSATFLAVLLVVGRLGGNFALGVAGAMVASVILAALPAPAGHRRLLLGRAMPAAAIALALFVVLLAIWMPEATYRGERVDPFDNVGSMHAIRYANIAFAVAAADRIIPLPQSYGQSLLAAIALPGLRPFPYLALPLWLAVSLTAFLAQVYGVLKHLRPAVARRRGKLAVGLGVFVFGGTGLTLLAHQVTDIGGPFAYISYADTALGFGTALVFLHGVATQPRRFAAATARALLLALLGFVWAASAAQNVVLILGVIAAGVVASLWRLCGATAAPRAAILPAVAALCGLLLGIGVSGGLLAPHAIVETADIPGVISPDQATNGAPHIAFVPGIPFFYAVPGMQWRGSWDIAAGQPETPPEPTADAAPVPSRFDPIIRRVSALRDAIFASEEAAGRSLRMIFIPTAALIAGFLSLAQGRAAVGDMLLGSDTLRFLLLVGAIALVIGVGACGLVAINGYKMELSRFLAPFILIGMLTAAAIAMRLTAHSAGWHLALVSVLLILWCGPTALNVLGRTIRVGVLGHRALCGLSVPERLSLLTRIDRVVGPMDCDEFRHRFVSADARAD